jgi:integrase
MTARASFDDGVVTLVISARLDGSDTASAEAISVTSPSPVLGLCRKFLDAGHDPNRPLLIGPRGGGLSNMSLHELRRRTGFGHITTHGFRTTFSDWAHERTAHSNHSIELSLAHSIGTAAEKSYRRGDMFAKRRKLMEAWSKYCCTPPVVGEKQGTVLTMRRQKA